MFFLINITNVSKTVKRVGGVLFNLCCYKPPDGTICQIFQLCILPKKLYMTDMFSTLSDGLKKIPEKETKHLFLMEIQNGIL